MNARPDWVNIARNIAEQREPLDALVVTNTRWVARDVIVPEMMKGLPSYATYNVASARISFPVRRDFATGRDLVTRISFWSVKTPDDTDGLRGLQFDLIFFDPNWDGPAALMGDILTTCRKRHVDR